jgi:hypothetical protein
MEGRMTKDQVEAVLARVPTWPEDRQQELAELALEIEAELAGADYEVAPDELTAIDEGLAGEAASEEEVKAAFALSGRHEGRIFEASHQRYQSNRSLLCPVRESGCCRTYRVPQLKRLWPKLPGRR